MNSEFRPAIQRLLLGATTAVLTVASAATGAAGPAPASGPVPGLQVTFIDHAVAPGDDFFSYANGAWLKVTEIPPDRSSWGADEELAELTTKRNAELIRNAGKAAPAGSEARKVGDYYASFMDEAGIEKLGPKPLEPGLQSIEAIHDQAALARALGATLRADVDILNSTNLYTPNLLGLWVAQDLNDPTR